MRHRINPSAASALLIFVSAYTAHATPITSIWLGGSGVWSDPSEWVSPPGIPQDGYQVLINNTTPLSVVTVDVPTAELNNVGIASQATLILAASLSAGELTSYGTVTLNSGTTLNAGTGGFVQDTATALTTIVSGSSFLDAGNYSQGGGATQINGILSTPLFHVTGGTVTTGNGGVVTIGAGGYTQDLAVTTQVAGGGQMNLSGDFSQGNGSTTVDGSLSTALFHVTGGTVTVGSGGTLMTGSGGYAQGDSGTATVISSGGQLTAAGGDYSQEVATVTTVDGTLSADNVNNSGIFTGSGTIDANFNDLGYIDPGDALSDVLSITGTYLQSGFLDIGIGGPADNDLLDVGGAASLGGTLDVSLLDGFAPTLGETFTIMKYASDTGAFDDVIDAGLPSGEFWGVSYDPTSVVLTLDESTVPEPATVLLSGAGLWLLLMARRRSRAYGHRRY